jgi:hypothetical protein
MMGEFMMALVRETTLNRWKVMGMVMVEFVVFTVTFPVVTGSVTVVGDTTLSDKSTVPLDAVNVTLTLTFVGEDSTNTGLFAE